MMLACCSRYYCFLDVGFWVVLVGVVYVCLCGGWLACFALGLILLVMFAFV